MIVGSLCAFTLSHTRTVNTGTVKARTVKARTVNTHTVNTHTVNTHTVNTRTVNTHTVNTHKQTLLNTLSFLSPLSPAGPRFSQRKPEVTPNASNRGGHTWNIRPDLLLLLLLHSPTLHALPLSLSFSPVFAGRKFAASAGKTRQSSHSHFTLTLHPSPPPPSHTHHSVFNRVPGSWTPLFIGMPRLHVQFGYLVGGNGRGGGE